jgi:hypothetical protein
MNEGNNCEENSVITAKQQQNGMRSFGFALPQSTSGVSARIAILAWCRKLIKAKR